LRARGSEPEISGGHIRKLTKLLGSDINLKILAVLSLGDNYPREISNLINVDETDISRRLRKLERMGLVSSYWGRIGGKNVKFYNLAVKNINFKFELGRLKIELPVGTHEEAIVAPFTSMPSQLFLVGREAELSKMAASSKPIILVWGPPGIGKTSLVSYYLRTHARDKPVYWHFSSSRDNLHELIIRIGSFLSYLGFKELLRVNKSDKSSLPQVLSEGLRATGSILVIDDYHLLPKDIRNFFNRLVENYELERIIIVSRVKESSLPFWRGCIDEIHLGPLSKDQTLELIRKSSPPDMMLTEADIELIWSLSRGIPIIIYSILNSLTRREELEEIGRSVLESYYNGALSEYLERKYRVILEILGLWKDWIRADYICKALDHTETTCEWILMKLSSTGLIERRGDYIRLREFLHNIINGVTDLRRKYYTLMLYRVLSRSSIYEDRINGLDLLARECINSGLSRGKQVSLADVIVLAGNVGVEQAAEEFGVEVSIPFTPGRVDAIEGSLDDASWSVMEPRHDGFRNYMADLGFMTPSQALIDKADMLNLTVSEMTVLLGGMRAMNANADGSDRGVLTDRPGVLSNDFFVNLLDMNTAWGPSSEAYVFEGRDRQTGDLKWTATEFDLVFGSNSELRAVVEFYAFDESRQRFIKDFASAWTKVMDADRFDIEDSGNVVVSVAQ
jgi:predicted transcriptional regulator